MSWLWRLLRRDRIELEIIEQANGMLVFSFRSAPTEAQLEQVRALLERIRR